MDYLSDIRARPSLPDMVTQKKIDTGTARLNSKSLEEQENEIKKVAQQFESIFINQVFKEMRKTVPESGLFDSYAMDMFQGMLDEEMSNELSKGNGLGLRDMIYKQLSSLDEKIRSQTQAKVQTFKVSDIERVSRAYEANK